MSYVIRRNEDGAFVTPPGQPASYTFDLTQARTFATQEAAQRECCGNERPAAVAACLQRPG